MVSPADWRTPSLSNGTGGNNCVEVRFLADRVQVRDSKDRGGPILNFTFPEWDAFVECVRLREFDLPPATAPK